MKRILLTILSVVLAVSCYDDTVLKQQLSKHEQEIAELKSICGQMNSNISSLQQLLDEMDGQGAVASMTPIVKNGEEVGCTLTFTNGSSVDLYYSTAAASAPSIGVAQDTDGLYYWTLNGEWLIGADNGKIKAQGVTPEFKVDNGHWYVSYDGCNTWEDLGVVTSQSSGCIFKNVDKADGYVTLTLSDDSTIRLPLIVNGVKSYYAEELAKTKATLRSLMTEPCLVFPMLTDIHYLAETSDSPTLIDDSINNMIELSKDCRFDFMVCLGDLTQGNKAMSETESEVKYVYDQFRRLGIPYYLSIGNHDTNIYYKVDGKYMKDHVFNLSQLYGLYVRDINDVVYDMSSMCGTNYYKDFYQFNTRFIFLNSNEGDDYGFSDETLAWFTNAMNTERDVYVFSHRKPGSTYHNDVEMTAVMAGAENFKMFFFGHVHYDCEYTAPFSETNPILSFAQRCNKCYQQNYGESWPEQAVLAERKVGTASEDCFDIVVLRPKSGKVNLVRFGGGVDREFDLVTGESVGESANVGGASYDLKIELDFSAGWPFVEPCAAAESQTQDGEEYTYSYTSNENGSVVNKQVKFAISKGKSADCHYTYVAPEGSTVGNLFYDIVDSEGSSNSFGLLSIPYVEGMYIQSVSVVHCSSDTRRFNVRKAWLTAAATTDASGWIKKNTILKWDFPLTASNKSTIAPGIGTASSGVRDYSISMRTADTNLKKATFYYSKTKPE